MPAASAAAASVPSVALCAALALPDPGAGGAARVPAFIHLLPAGVIRTRDGRGPYRLADAAAVIARSLPAGGASLPVDENHATDLAAPKGAPAPARGWIVELQARADGVWGRANGRRAGDRGDRRGNLRPASGVIAFSHPSFLAGGSGGGNSAGLKSSRNPITPLSQSRATARFRPISSNAVG